MNENEGGMSIEEYRPRKVSQKDRKSGRSSTVKAIIKGAAYISLAGNLAHGAGTVAHTIEKVGYDLLKPGGTLEQIKNDIPFGGSVEDYQKEMQNANTTPKPATTAPEDSNK